MARRRLSDLLREEAKKPSDDAAAAAEAEPSADEPDAEDADLPGETAAIAPDSASTKASTDSKSRSAKRTDVAEPNVTPAQNQDETLLQKITDLTSTLDAQKETIEQLKTDLEQTRKDARQLADSNAKLTEALKTSQTQKTIAETSALTKVAESHSLQALTLAPPPEPVATSENSVKSFNRDVGWFD